MLCNHFDSILNYLERYKINSIEFTEYKGNTFPVYQFHIKINHHHALITYAGSSGIETLFYQYKKLISCTDDWWPHRLHSSYHLKQQLTKIIQQPITITENLSTSLRTSAPPLPRILNGKLRLGDTFKSRFYAIQINIGPVTYEDYLSLIQHKNKLSTAEICLKRMLGPLCGYTVIIDIIKSTAPNSVLGGIHLAISSWLH